MDFNSLNLFQVTLAPKAMPGNSAEMTNTFLESEKNHVCVRNGIALWSECRFLEPTAARAVLAHAAANALEDAGNASGYSSNRFSALRANLKGSAMFTRPSRSITVFARAPRRAPRWCRGRALRRGALVPLTFESGAGQVGKHPSPSWPMKRPACSMTRASSRPRCRSTAKASTRGCAKRAESCVFRACTRV